MTSKPANAFPLSFSAFCITAFSLIVRVLHVCILSMTSSSDPIFATLPRNSHVDVGVYCNKNPKETFGYSRMPARYMYHTQVRNKLDYMKIKKKMQAIHRAMNIRKLYFHFPYENFFESGINSDI